jgi:putative membrane protein insertion efficiency factor
MNKIKEMPKHLALLLIKFYQYFISPLLGSHCRFTPSCSHYTVDCFHKYGFIKATGKAIWRILRCHPFSKGGDDPA